MAKTVKFRSFLKIGRGVMGKNNPKTIFAFAENRNSDLQNFPLCNKFFTNYKIIQILPFLLDFCIYTVVGVSCVVMARCIKWF